MQIKRNIVLKRTDNKPIIIDTFYSKEKTNQPVIVFCHGYKGFKDWGAWSLMAEHFSKSGFCFVKFNFSHNGGTVENPIDFPDLEAFGNNNYSKELEDLGDVLNWVQDHFNNNEFVNINHINLIGHSRGGGIVLIKASEDARIKSVITLASVSDYEKRSSTTGDLKAWKDKGVKYVLNGRTKQEMPHYIQFYEDFMANKNRLSIESAVKKLKIPLLIIHGNKDTSVSVEEAQNLHRWCPNSIFKTINNADHVFNTKHPWDNGDLSEELYKVSNIIVEFLYEN